MSVTNSLNAKRFLASNFSGTHQAQVQAAINAANTYATGSTAADLFDDSASLYPLKNTTAKGAAAKAGPNALQAVAEDDVGGVMQVTGGVALTMKNNVRLEFSKDVKVPVGTTTMPDFIKVAGADNFTVTTKPGALQTARSGFGTNVKHPEWSAGKAVVDLRGSIPGSGSGLRIENNRLSYMDGTAAGGGAQHFKYQNLFIIGNNDCAAPGAKQGISFFTPKGPDQVAAIKYGIFIDLDFCGCYSGYGAWQISAAWRTLWANCRTHGGTMWRNEADAHFSGGQTANYGVSQCDFIAGYGEDCNKVLTMQPNLSKVFTSWFVDGIYGISCLETANAGQFTGGSGTDQSFSQSQWGEIWGYTGTHSAWQEQNPCMVNPTAGVYVGAGPIPGSIWGSVKYNLGHAGGTGAGADGTGAEVPFNSRDSAGKVNGTRDNTMTPDTIRARWASKKVVLGSGAPTVPGQPTLTGPTSPQLAPYNLTVSGTTDKASDWEWRLTTGGTPGAWVAKETNSTTGTKTFPALTVNSYVVEARCTNSAGTSLVSFPFALAVNTGGGAPSKAVITSGPAASTTLSSATFAFSAAGSSSLEYSLDGAGFLGTPSPKTVSGLGLGSHTFRVQGINGSGTGPMSDTYGWTIVSSGAVAAISAVTLSGTSIVDKQGEWASTDTGSLIIPFPNGISTGDFMLLIVGWGSVTPILIPTGWSALPQSQVIAGSSLGLMVCQRVYSGSEGQNVTVNGPDANGGSGIIIAVSGAYSVAPVASTSSSSSG